MAIISLSYRYLERLTGTGKERSSNAIPMIGSEVERIEEDHADVEFFPNRPDLFSVEGAGPGNAGISRDRDRPPEVFGETLRDQVHSSTRNWLTSGPALRSAVIRNVSFDDESILSVMALQEALHWAVGRGRSKVAIGIHDLDTVTPPFHYMASPRAGHLSRSISPKELTLDEILEQHPKGRDYAKIVRDFPLFP